MKIPSAIIGYLIIALCLTACSQKEKTAFHDQFFAFGTLIDITLYDVDSQQAEALVSQIQQRFASLHTRWHAWQPGELHTLNSQLALQKTALADSSLLAVLTTANQLSQQSGGLFNPVIGKLVALWGFHDNALPIGTLPSEQDIDNLLSEAPSVSDVQLETTRLSTNNPAVLYDLGGFAKGVAIDQAIELLKAAGVKNAIINAGGDLRAIGRHGDRPWRIGIRHPREPGILASLEISDDSSVFTSGDYERFFEVDGRRFHHIIDPRSGYPATGTMSVTVIHDNAAGADAAATALFVAGPELWVETSRNMGIKYVMLIDSQGNIHINPAMQSRLQFEPDFDARIIPGPSLQ